MATPSTGQSGMTATAVQLPPERPEYVGDIIGGGIGIFGALAGAYAAYRWGLKAAREAKASEKKERNQQIDFSLIHKLIGDASVRHQLNPLYFYPGGSGAGRSARWARDHENHDGD